MKKNLNLKVYSFDTKTNLKLQSLCESFSTSETNIIKMLINIYYNDIIIKNKDSICN